MKGTNLGEILKNQRTRYGYTQKDISDFLGVNQSLISKVESGERAINIDMLEKLSSLYCCDLVDSSASPNRNFQVAFRAKTIETSDLKTIQAVHRIVLNSMFMTDLLEEN